MGAVGISFGLESSTGNPSVWRGGDRDTAKDGILVVSVDAGRSRSKGTIRNNETEIIKRQSK